MGGRRLRLPWKVNSIIFNHTTSCILWPGNDKRCFTLVPLGRSSHQALCSTLSRGLGNRSCLDYQLLESCVTQRKTVLWRLIKWRDAQWVRALHSTCKVSIFMNSHEKQICFQTPACHACSTQAWRQREIEALVNLRKLLYDSWHLNLRATLGEIIHWSILISM